MQLVNISHVNLISVLSLEQNKVDCLEFAEKAG